MESKQAEGPSATGGAHFRTDHLLGDLKGRSIRGAALTVAVQATGFTLKLGSTAILARLLVPADFGLVAMVTALTNVFARFQTMGLPSATVQRDAIDHRQVSTLFWINLGAGGVLMLVTMLLAPWIARLYGEVRLEGIALLVATTFLFQALGVQHQALMRRQMRFGALAAGHVLSLAVGVVLAVVLASTGAGYWALVAMVPVTALAASISAWVLCDWRPGPPRRATGVRSMVAFGGNVAGSTILTRAYQGLDHLLIGAVWGGGALGLYSKAHQLLQLPERQISAPISRVALPGLSRLQNNPEKYRNYYCVCLTLMVTLGLPLVTFALVDAEKIVVLLLGEAWRGAVPIFQCLAPAAMVGTVHVTMKWLFMPLGRSDRQLRCVFMRTVYTAAALALGLGWGPTGLAIAYSVSQCLFIVPELAYACAGTPIRLSDVGRSIWRPVAMTGIAAGLTFLLARHVAPASGPALGLLFDAALYTGLCLLSGLALARDPRRLVATFCSAMLQVRSQLFLFWRFVVQKHFLRSYVISRSAQKGRRCVRRGPHFIKIVPQEHPRCFSFVNEMKVTRELQDLSFVPRFVGCQKRGRQWRFSYRYRNYMSLGEMLKHRVPISEDQYRRIEEGLRRSLAQLRERRIAHRDINPSNILVDAECRKILLTDYQWAIHAGDEIEVTRGDAVELKRCLESLNKKFRPESNDADLYQADVQSANNVLAAVRSLVRSDSPIQRSA